jgi:hypothetical protein
MRVRGSRHWSLKVKVVCCEGDDARAGLAERALEVRKPGVDNDKVDVAATASAADVRMNPFILASWVVDPAWRSDVQALAVDAMIDTRLRIPS